MPGAPCTTSVHDLATRGWCPVTHVLLVCMIWLPLAGAWCPNVLLVYMAWLPSHRWCLVLHVLLVCMTWLPLAGAQ